MHTYISLEVHYDKLHEERVVVTGVKTVPESEEEERYYLAVYFRAEKL